MKKRIGIGVAVLGLAAAVAAWAIFGRARQPDHGPFRVGEQLVYRVEHTSAGYSDFSAVLGKDAGTGRHSMHSWVQGELVLTVLRRRGEVVELVARVRGVTALLASDGTGLIDGAAITAQLAEPVALEATPAGHIRRLWVPAGWSSASRGVLRALLAAAQFVFPEAPAPSWELRQQDDHGTAVVAYESRDGTVRRVRRSYAPVEDRDDPAEQRITPVARPEGELTAAVDAAGRVVRIDGTEGTTLLVDGREVVRTEARVAFALVSHDKLRRDRLDDLLAARDAAVRDGEEITLLNQASDEAVDAAFARTTLGEMTLPEYLDRLAAAGPDDETQMVLKGRALAYLQAQAVDSFARLLLKAPPESRQAQVLWQALVQSGQPGAQRELAGLVRARKNDAAFLMEVLPSLGTVRKPTPEIDRVLKEVATAAADPDVRWTAQLALGALARTLARGEPARSAAIADWALIELERATSAADRRQALLVVGNTGAARALPAIRRHLAASDAAVRGAAVSALRWHKGEEAEAALVRALADADDQVRQEAVTAFEVRPPSASGVAALCGVLARDNSAAIRLGALNRLRQLAEPGEEVVAALRRAAANDPSEEVRQAAAEALSD